jgi:hypothetical protein
LVADRISSLLAIVRADPSDRLGHWMLGSEYLAAGRPSDAIPHLRVWCEGASEGPTAGREPTDDVGAGCLALATALEATGDPVGAARALEMGLSSALRHRHRALAASIEAARARLAEERPS